MLADLANLKLFGAFLQRVEANMDYVSAVSELEKQVGTRVSISRRLRVSQLETQGN